MMNEPLGLWIYAVINNQGEFPIAAKGIRGTSPIEIVGHGEFAMVVSEEPMKKYPLVRDTLIAHQLVNETVMRVQPVLPVRFCTMAESKQQIIDQVLVRKEKVDEFHKALEKVRGKNEYGLRCRWKNLDDVFARLAVENEKVRTTKAKMAAISEHQRRAAMIEVGHVVKEALEDKKETVAQSVLQNLSPHASETKQNNVLGDVNILNMAFLVEEKKQPQFDEAIQKVVAEYDSGIQFKYVGPIPPFNFVELVIHFDQQPKTEPKVSSVGTQNERKNDGLIG